MNDEHLRYPIGKFSPQESYTPQELEKLIERIEALPSKMEVASRSLSPTQLDMPYREGGWTLRQVIHHVPESHMNAYIRIKWTLTEETPTIKAYDENGWAKTPEYVLGPEISLELLKALHVKWIALLRRLSPTDLQRQYFHPDSKKYNRLDRVIALYAWHGDHHLAHITSLKERSGWK